MRTDGALLSQKDTGGRGEEQTNTGGYTANNSVSSALSPVSAGGAGELRGMAARQNTGAELSRSRSPRRGATIGAAASARDGL